MRWPASVTAVTAPSRLWAPTAPGRWRRDAATATAAAATATVGRSARPLHVSADDEQRAARAWLAAFRPTSIPRQACEVTFSRSSGPGGQNVNKTSSKATLRMSMAELRPLLPAVVHDELRRSRYFATNSDSLVLQSDESRRQGDNVEGCYRKLYDTIMEAARGVVRGETSPEQAKRVQHL